MWGTMKLPQKISNISIAHDYEAIILFVATTAVRLTELLSFRISCHSPSDPVPAAFNTSFENDRKNLKWPVGYCS